MQQQHHIKILCFLGFLVYNEKTSDSSSMAVYKKQKLCRKSLLFTQQQMASDGKKDRINEILCKFRSVMVRSQHSIELGLSH